MPQDCAVYTHGHHESVLRSHTWRTAANSAGYLLDALTADLRAPGTEILDVGCGPGTITADLAALVPHGRVTGLERAPEVLEQARATAAARGLRNVRFAVGDVHALDHPDGFFHVTHAHQVLQHVGDPVGALREMRRVTRPGGLVAARDADYAAMTWYPALDGLTDWLDLYRRVARANGGEPDAGRRLHSWARRAGFAAGDITASAGTWCYATAQERAWWSALWADRTVHSSYARLAVEGGHASRAELERIADAWREWGSREDAWFAVLHGEILCRV
ncbi:methyltransferase domain-containing protein [Streptomyces sp. MST-110588]|uniref:methyltransferase domain-containing protein n=1 Tax=Streptomyces sp. MST-110588 TaxID=2833628 RepID=UPI001F5DE7CB|nr:methyltransferase domain-containing protein [Streptomyces sp. MST-110588]UNO39230.1 class I SAM-dependent methyltransferase [Streptomyces sp. MST-110588]